MERDQYAVGGGVNVRLEIAIPEFDSVPKRPFGVLRMSARTAAMGEADGRLINEVRVQHGRDRTVGTVPGCVCRCGSPRSSLILVSCRSTRPCCGCRPCAQVHPSTSANTSGCSTPGPKPRPQAMSRGFGCSSTSVSAFAATSTTTTRQPTRTSTRSCVAVRGCRSPLPLCCSLSAAGSVLNSCRSVHPDTFS